MFPRLRHPRDLADPDLARARGESVRPDLLDELVETGRAVFGFFPDHYPYTINYPSVLERLESLPAGARVLDVGAGVSPLPIALARRDLLLECIDNSPSTRAMPVTAEWNEWGFFDYSVVDVRIQSHNLDVREHVSAQTYDRIYSVSVLAHMTRIEREETVELVSQWLRPGGRLLLAVDLLPKSDFLWNRSQGVEVESPLEHGTVDDLCRSVGRAGLRVTERKIRRTVFASRTDLLFLEAVRPALRSSGCRIYGAWTPPDLHELGVPSQSNSRSVSAAASRSRSVASSPPAPERGADRCHPHGGRPGCGRRGIASSPRSRSSPLQRQRGVRVHGTDRRCRSGDVAARSGACGRSNRSWQVAIVIPSLRSGARLQTAWLDFGERTGIPVVIDGAATSSRPPTDPTGSREASGRDEFSCNESIRDGEGGCVALTETGAVEQIGQVLNFGFSGSRDSATPSSTAS